MFSATYPWNHLLDSRLRTWAVVDPVQTYPLGPENRVELVEMGTVMGKEGSEYQNPNVWQGRGVLAYPSLHSPGLEPAYGVGVAADYTDVVLNVQATQHLAVIEA